MSSTITLKLVAFFTLPLLFELVHSAANVVRVEREGAGAKKKENLFISADENGDSRVDMHELARYVRGDKFWKAVWAVDNSDEAIHKYGAFFTPEKLAALDLNKDGRVDDGELRKYSLAYIKEWMDIDRDGFISKWEFEMNMNILMGDTKK